MDNKIMVNINGIDRDATPEEIESILAKQVSEKVKADAEKTKAQAKAQAKATLLERLGLTQEEFNTLTA
jgi:hypothetical protein